MPKYYNATEVANLMSYPHEIRKFLLRSRGWVQLCIQDALENSTDTDIELRLNISWQTIMQSIFVLNDGKQFCKWKQDRMVENRPFCKACGKVPDIPKELRGNTWKEIELPTSEDLMPKFTIGRMFLALKKELEADGFMVSFDFTKDHSPMIQVSAKGDEKLAENYEKFGYSPDVVTNDSAFLLASRRFITSILSDNMEKFDEVSQKIEFPMRELFDGIFETDQGRYVKWKKVKTCEPVPQGIRGNRFERIDFGDSVMELFVQLEEDSAMRNRGFSIYVDWRKDTISVQWTGHLVKVSDLFEGEKVLTEGSVADVGHIKK